VHATDPDVRATLLGKREETPILELMRRLSAHRITMHTQIVLCPGINDGAVLKRTVDDLVSLYPAVASLAIVPLGLTRHRERLPQLQPVDAAYARSFVAEWEPRWRELAERLGTSFLSLADEFYIKGELPFPTLEAYGDLPQLENGVGMIPLFLEEAREVLEYAVQLTSKRVTVVTGESPYRYLSDYLRALAEKTQVSLHAYAIPNRLFGELVTVTGLVAGEDIVDALSGKDLGDFVIVPDVMLKEGEGVFLDDMSINHLSERLGKRVEVVEATPWGLYNALKEGGAAR
jgi:putative radical SAM enzyme (TIGR03279 family)